MKKISTLKYNINRLEEGWILFNDLNGLIKFLIDFQDTMFYKEKYIDLIAFPQRLLVIFLFNRDLKEDWLLFLNSFTRIK